MKQRGVFLSAILAAIIVMIFANCSGSNTEDPKDKDQTGYFKLKTTGLKSLYVSDMRVQSEAHAAIDNSSLQTLSYINATGQNSPVFFASPSGKIIVLEVSGIERIDDQRIVVNFNSFYEVSEKKIEGVTAYVVGEAQYPEYDGYYGGNRALIDWSSGKVYDFKDQGNVLFAQDGNLYTGSGYYYYPGTTSGALYKINLNTLSAAEPLNNASFYPVNGLYAPIVLNNKIISQNGYSFDINQSFQPQPVKSAAVTISGAYSPISGADYPIVFGYKDWDTDGYPKYYNYNNRFFLIQDLEGTYWYFNVYGNHYSSSSNYTVFGLNVYRIQTQTYDEETGTLKYEYIWDYTQEPYIVCKPAIDSTGQMSVLEPTYGKLSFPTGDGNDYYGHTASIFFLDPGENGTAKMLYDFSSGFYGSNDNFQAYRNNGAFILFKNGFIKITKKAKGLQVDSTALSLPSNLSSLNSFINKDNYLYWLENKAIKRLFLGTDSSAETVYSNSRIIDASSSDKVLLTASGKNLIFYAMAEDNVSVYTYSLPMYTPGAQPSILATSDVQVRDIVELKF